ncbi:gluconokinase [Pseudarthrobacter sp. J64]|uniref:gluconokinase n=1 Tax=Pseudarthrobacter sp. J64 TaxID=3116485 RepID=UPI002E82441B|nr:gluconokinase [Pseudarthrobacter sp. J64]MEE2568734.1 gluconokinase [Pseudarthrobacter sp. J64]
MKSAATHLVVMGVAGAGKTTLAEALSARLGWAMAEADEFHPQSNIAKMNSGTPLDDEDRWPWLRAIRDWMTAQAQAGQSTVLTCSALKQSYRELLSETEGNVVFLHLSGDPELLGERIRHRTGHFMPSTLLPSQLATLEPLTDQEIATGSLVLDISRTPQQLVEDVLSALHLHANN